MNKKIIFSAIFLLCFAAGALAPRFLMGQKVDTVLPHTGEAIEVIYATGTVEPTIMVPIAPKNAGHLTELAASEGQTVKKGEILAQLENTEQQAVITDLTVQLKFAEDDFNRKRQLYNAKSISRDIFEKAQSSLESLKAQLEKAEAQAAYTTLIAPADGLIIKRDGQIGELIGSGQPIFYISCCAPLRITAEVDEEDIPQVKKGQKVLIQTDAYPNTVFHGEITSITPKGDPVSRSYRVRLSFDDNEGRLMIGMTTETNIITKKSENALLIPISALSNDNRVIQVVNNIAKYQKVETGIQGTDTIEIVSGLSKESTVISKYDTNIKDGQKVRGIPKIESAK